MIRGFYAYILAGYEDASLEIKRRTKLLLTCSLLMIFVDIPAIIIIGFDFLKKPGSSPLMVLGMILSFFVYILIIYFLRRKKYNFSSTLILLMIMLLLTLYVFSRPLDHYYLLIFYSFVFSFVIVISLLVSSRISQIYFIVGYYFLLLLVLMFKAFMTVPIDFKGDDTTLIAAAFLLLLFIGLIVASNFKLAKEYLDSALAESEKNKKNADENRQLLEGSIQMITILSELAGTINEITLNLNSASIRIQTAAQEQTSGSGEQASGITEVSATLEELSLTAKQITKNAGELVIASGEVIKFLEATEKELLVTISQLDEVSNASTKNTMEIGELSKRSVIINEMVELIKEVANKTNILSINASIEASRSGEAGTGFAVVASEIRELSRETILSAKNVEKTAFEIQDFLNSIVISSESESKKVIESNKTVKKVFANIDDIVAKINNNYTFTQKIDVSIKQQESGSKQAADTMRQMSEIARQSAETARQTLAAVKEIASYSMSLDAAVQKFIAKGNMISEKILNTTEG